MFGIWIPGNTYLNDIFKFNYKNDFLIDIVKNNFNHGKYITHEKKSAIFHEDFLETVTKEKSNVASVAKKIKTKKIAVELAIQKGRKGKRIKR